MNIRLWIRVYGVYNRYAIAHLPHTSEKKKKNKLYKSQDHGADTVHLLPSVFHQTTVANRSWRVPFFLNSEPRPELH